MSELSDWAYNKEELAILAGGYKREKVEEMSVLFTAQDSCTSTKREFRWFVKVFCTNGGDKPTCRNGLP